MNKIAILLSFTVFLLSGCVPADRIEDILEVRESKANLPIDQYMIAIGFRDASGNDLVAPLEAERWIPKGDAVWWGGINPAKYNLDIILPNPHDSWDNSIYNFRATNGFTPDVNKPSLTMKKYDERYNCTSSFGAQYQEGDGNWYLINTFISPAMNGIQNYLTYKITCPTIFGDNSVHELIVMWNSDSHVSDKDRNSGDLFPEATNATFEGKTVSINKLGFIDIVLDR